MNYTFLGLGDMYTTVHVNAVGLAFIRTPVTEVLEDATTLDALPPETKKRVLKERATKA